MDKHDIHQDPLLSVEEQDWPQSKQDSSAPSPSSEFIRPYTGRTGRRRRSALKIKLLQLALGSSIFLFSLTILLLWIYISGLSAENNRISAEFNKQRRHLVAATAALEKLQNERNALVQGRLPYLLPLEYDRAISVTDQYLRNIIFTLTKNQGETATEYRVVLQNDGSSAIYPEVKILLFDKLGIQVGSAEITNGEQSSDEAILDPGEVRSYSGSVNFFRPGNPHYFHAAVY
ncbi:hypothetical protein Noc_0955 [Nitrosococcus oceani ATCC 19707]|uniref:Uncharacterized protein n=2 Tax=Nitrosococcus oceani TaxID=1229 RepID=Q3JCI0_NITOC|nr:hypothetical protein [Nitrosococcus oceani]ABA57466.1 hypothetical protein Noc_0955 [Nitrosococcus oceani ATCC 19707]EDZ66794.1 hypothetical protein NOC27_121 [Nitrosococcus oceani AFC27]KFI20160.1 hypothetical protein IB75_04890 [Nitrosococcus oceani C-27]